MKFGRIIVGSCVVALTLLESPVLALNGGTVHITPRNGWRAFEVISVGDNPAGDGFSWAMPSTFDGMGAWLPDSSTLRLEINHENIDATISEVNLNLANFKTAISNVISSGNTGGITFVTSARQAYGRWTDNGGSTWTTTNDVTTTSFYRFCSGQFHTANAFGSGRGFADNMYITGEEGSTNRLFAIDLANRDFYLLSGVAGSAAGGLGGMPFDSYENAALLDTGDTTHVALLLSPDGGTQFNKLYIGDKGKDSTGAASNSFLSRNGLAYGRYYYLNGTFPTSAASPATSGTFSTSTVGALNIAKLEDVDTNPNDGSQLVQAIQETGLFTYDFNLAFSGGEFSTSLSSFSLKKIRDQNNDTDGLFGDPDNVDWTSATVLNGITYPNGLIFVNEDSATANGETWRMLPDGSGLSLVADTIPNVEAAETAGIIDISTLVGYKPGSILLTNNQGTTASQTVLISPNASLIGDFNGDGVVNSADYVVWRKGFGDVYNQSDYDVWRTQFGGTPGSGSGASDLTATTIPEPTAVVLILTAIALTSRRSRNTLLAAAPLR